MENTRERSWRFSRPGNREGRIKFQGDGRGRESRSRSGGKSIRIPENGRKETEREKEAEKESGQQKHGWTKILATAEDFEEIAEEIQEELEITGDGFEERPKGRTPAAALLRQERFCGF